jgi:hypothetical protein
VNTAAPTIALELTFADALAIEIVQSIADQPPQVRGNLLPTRLIRDFAANDGQDSGVMSDSIPECRRHCRRSAPGIPYKIS